jgi:hypothetical protein
MPNWVIFYFLWDDPLFGYLSGNAKDYVDDPEFIELHRKVRLSALQLLYRQIEMLQQQLAREKELHRENVAREVWTSTQLFNILEVTNPREALQVLVDRDVNEMDPDFSWVRWLREVTQ